MHRCNSVSKLIGRVGGIWISYPNVESRAGGKRAELTGAASSGAICAAHSARLYEQFRGITRGDIRRQYLSQHFTQKNIARSMKQCKVKRLANGYRQKWSKDKRSSSWMVCGQRIDGSLVVDLAAISLMPAKAISPKPF